MPLGGGEPQVAPVKDIPWRCAGFKPKPGDPDQRTGARTGSAI